MGPLIFLLVVGIVAVFTGCTTLSVEKTPATASLPSPAPGSARPLDAVCVGQPTAADDRAALAADQSRDGWPEVFKVAIFAGGEADDVTVMTEPVRQFLQERLALPVELLVATSNTAVVETLRTGQVMAAQIDPFAFVLAEQETGVIPLGTIAAPVGQLTEFSEDVRPYHFGIFTTLMGSGIERLDQLADIEVAFVDPASASGRNAPVIKLIDTIDALESPADVDRWLKPVFAGSQSTAQAALINGQVQVATISEASLVRGHEELGGVLCGYDDGRVGIPRTEAELAELNAGCPTGSLIAIAQTDPLPNPPFVILPELPATFRAAVRDALLSTADDPDLIAELGTYYVAPETYLPTIDSTCEFYTILRRIRALTVEP